MEYASYLHMTKLKFRIILSKKCLQTIRKIMPVSFVDGAFYAENCFDCLETIQIPGLLLERQNPHFKTIRHKLIAVANMGFVLQIYKTSSR